MNTKDFSVAHRAAFEADLAETPTDVLIVGGGINGAVSLAACASAGLRTALVDRGDFGSFTSQSSSNLIWGGIKYLENYEFFLVSKLCACRNRLMRNFPSAVKEIRFFTLHEKTFRYPLWFMYLGSWVYQVIGRFATKNPRFFSAAALKHAAPLANRDLFDGGFEYSDAMLPENDARFVFSFIQKAYDAGAVALNYCELVDAKYDNERWHCTLKNSDGKQWSVQTRCLINCAGPYADALNEITGMHSDCSHIFSKGIHLIFPRIDDKHRVITSFADDGRLFFCIPMGERTCVGTTDTITEKPDVHVTPEDRAFLLNNINRILNLPKPLTEADIIAERCGVRPLAAASHQGDTKSGDWFKLSRKHVISVDQGHQTAAVYGGKLTDCLNVAGEILDIVKNRFGLDAGEFDADRLAEPPAEAKQQFLEACQKLNTDASGRPDDPLSERLWRRYCDRADRVLALLQSDPSLLEPIAPGMNIYRIDEVMAYTHEMAQNRADFLRRRTMAELLYRREELDQCTLTYFTQT